MRLAVDARLPFTHGFEQCTLSSRWCPIDFVSQDNVCKDRSLVELEFAIMINTAPDNIGRQQVRCELNARENAIDALCKSFCHKCFSDARDIFEQNMLASQQGYDGFANDFHFSEHDRFHIGFQSLENGLYRRIHSVAFPMIAFPTSTGRLPQYLPE